MNKRKRTIIEVCAEHVHLSSTFYSRPMAVRSTGDTSPTQFVMTFDNKIHLQPFVATVSIIALDILSGTVFIVLLRASNSIPLIKGAKVRMSNAEVLFTQYHVIQSSWHLGH